MRLLDDDRLPRRGARWLRLALALVAAGLLVAARPADIGRAGSVASAAAQQAAPAFPSTGLIDTFDGRRGKLPPDWFGSEGMRSYRIQGGIVKVNRGGPLYWRLESFGPDQEAYLTLVTVDARAPAQGLVLKAQRNNWRRGAITVTYDAPGKAVVVRAFSRESRAWTELARLGATVANGDVLGARALADGRVLVFVNGALLGEADAGAAYGQLGGRVGVWFAGANGAEFDSFGGGDVPQAAPSARRPGAGS